MTTLSRQGLGDWWGDRSVIERRLVVGVIAVLVG